MKRYLLIVLALGALLTSAQASPKPFQKATRTEQELGALLKQFVEALRQSDLPTIERLLAPDYVEVSPAGEVDPREKVISFYQPQAQTAPAPEAITVDELKVRSYGELALVIARQTFKRQVNGQTREAALRVTYVCRRQQGHWQLVSTHYTGIRPAPAKPPAQ
jgi:ketosteroid isomerase-like protein